MTSSVVSSDHDLLIRIKQILDSFISEVDKNFTKIYKEQERINECVCNIRTEFRNTNMDCNIKHAALSTKIAVIETDLKNLKENFEDGKNDAKDRTATWISIAALLIGLVSALASFLF